MKGRGRQLNVWINDDEHQSKDETGGKSDADHQQTELLPRDLHQQLRQGNNQCCVAEVLQGALHHRAVSSNTSLTLRLSPVLALEKQPARRWSLSPTPSRLCFRSPYI
ncbi:MAG: hypothetical protein ABI977_11185 [Acidobacteriota bacterium]